MSKKHGKCFDCKWPNSSEVAKLCPCKYPDWNKLPQHEQERIMQEHQDAIEDALKKQ